MSFDLFFFCLFYEVAVLPMYLLIAIWGSTNKEYASLKLVIYLLAGSALMLTGVLALFYYSDVHTFNILTLATKANFSRQFQLAVFPLLALGCGVLAAMWPFHTWSPDGHVAAPTAVSMLHAGVLMKLGAYGILRVAIFILPQGAVFWAPCMATLALVNIVYGALVAIMQKDLKYMIGYSSVSHMGIVIFGLSTLNLNGMNGACFQMFSHGIMTALFFSSVGFIYDMAHTRNVDELGGIAKKIPLASSFFIVAGLCGLGLPTLSGFPAELLVYMGAYKAFPLYFWIAVIGLVLTAFYVLRIIQRGFFGPLNEKVAHHLHDATPWQAFPRVVLIITLIFFGLAPFTMLNMIQTATGPLVETLKATAKLMAGM